MTPPEQRAAAEDRAASLNLAQRVHDEWRAAMNFPGIVWGETWPRPDHIASWVEAYADLYRRIAGALEYAVAQAVNERDFFIQQNASAMETVGELADKIAEQAEEIARLRETLGFIESAALFHPDQAWPDELKAQLRRVGKLAHEALRREETK